PEPKLITLVRAFSDEVDTGSASENAPKQNLGGFRFRRNGRPPRLLAAGFSSARISRVLRRSPAGPACAISRPHMTRFALQFGQTQSGLTYLERMSAYGVCPRGEAYIAVAQIGSKPPYEYDLPGGGIEADEDEAAALMREFQEETGLTVWP